MHVVIAGGTGLIGRRLCDSLVRRGHRVTLLTRRIRPSEDLPEHVRVLSWDGQQPVDLEKAEGRVDAVVNLCGEGIADKRWNQHRERILTASRLEPTRALVQSILNMKRKPEVFVQASAVGYYGPRGDELLHEDSAPGDGFLSRLCLDWEAASELVTQSGVRQVVLRTGVVLDPEGGALPRMIPPFQFFFGGPLGNGRQWFPWIHFEDVSGILVFILENLELHGPLNVTAPGILPNRQFSEVLAKVMHRPCWAPVPAFVLRLAFGEMSQLLLEGQRAEPRRILQAGYNFRFPSAAAALSDILPNSD